MKRKKVIKIILIMFPVLILDFFYGYFYTNYTSSRPAIIHINEDFFKSEEFHNLKNNYSITKSYYSEEIGKEITNKRKYLLVGDNVQNIREYINMSLENIKQSNENDYIEFNSNIITSNDYYKLLKNGDSLYLHYYDVDDNVLYMFDVKK